MTDYTAKRVLLKNADGEYLVPFTDKMERDLSDVSSAGVQAILDKVHTDGMVLQYWSADLTPTANKTVVVYQTGAAASFYLNKTGVNTSTSPGQDTTNWEMIPMGASGANTDLSNLTATGEAHFQAPLISGTNIKTVNSTSLLGSGNIAVQATLVSGTNIKTVNSTSLLGSGNIAVQATITGAATTITSSNLTASRALVSNGSGKVAVSSITSTKLGYLTDVTSNIQAQLDKKEGTPNYSGRTAFTLNTSTPYTASANGWISVTLGSSTLLYVDGQYTAGTTYAMQIVFPIASGQKVTLGQGGIVTGNGQGAYFIPNK